MKISIIMAVYNGSKYIKEQMKSIMDQTINIDEVLIFDDCSTDNTANIVSEFIDFNKLSWIFTVNSINLGWKRNFLENLFKATGDIIFISDQDDVWDKYKIEKVVKHFIENEDARVISTAYALINSRGELIKKHELNYKKFSENFSKFNSNIIFYSPGYAAGNTLAIRKDFLKLIDIESLRNLNYQLPYDYFLSLTASYLGKLYFINEVLLLHRIHDENATQKANIKYIGQQSKFYRINEIEDLRSIMNILIKNQVNRNNWEISIEEIIAVINDRLNFLNKKDYNYLFNKKKFKVFKFVTIIGDIAYLLNINNVAGFIYQILKEIIFGKFK